MLKREKQQFIAGPGVFEADPAWKSEVRIRSYAPDVPGFEFRVRKIKEVFKLPGIEPNKLMSCIEEIEPI
jgi:hypothetical protein